MQKHMGIDDTSVNGETMPATGLQRLLEIMERDSAFSPATSLY